MMQTIERAKEQSTRRVDELRTRLSEGIAKKVDGNVSSKITIFATGSLARLEANPFSDLDAFFYVNGPPTARLDTTDEIEVFHTVMEAANASRFPDFSGGGEYLEFQFLDHVVDNIGSRQDDYINGLTSRMLLMLESKFIYNEDVYKSSKEKVVERYFADFHAHSENFRPIFILNDVLRFWRTLCLNYEHSREWRVLDEVGRAKGHLKNLKLRFSRLMICYSFIASLLNEGPAIQGERVLEIASLTPLERLNLLRSDPQSRPFIDSAVSHYTWFMDAMNQSKEDCLRWISEEETRVDAFRRGNLFVEDMYKLVVNIADRHSYLRYLII